MKSSLELPDIRNFDPDSIEQKIVRTIDRLGIDPSRAVVVGSAALTLYGVELQDRIDGIARSRPHDVDLSVDVTTFLSQCEAEQARLKKDCETPPSLKLAKDLNQTLLTIPAKDPNHLPVDIITRYQGQDEKKSIQKYDAGFASYYRKNSLQLPGSNGIRVITQDRLVAELEKHRFLDEKYDRDLWSYYEARNKKR